MAGTPAGDGGGDIRGTSAGDRSRCFACKHGRSPRRHHNSHGETAMHYTTNFRGVSCGGFVESGESSSSCRPGRSREAGVPATSASSPGDGGIRGGARENTHVQGCVGVGLCT